MIKIEKIDNIAASRKYPPTSPQWQAIAITGADILVAAAAGSGKTEVLSERIARKVATNRWDIDRLLVLTFTTAAAKNMIVRIEDKISERLLSTKREEDLLFLRKQRMLMNDAYVSTIDSFCLNVLKKFYYLVEEKIDNQITYLSPNFSILANSKGLLTETIGNVLERFVQEDSISSDLLFAIFGSKQNISSFIMDIYYKLLNIPNFLNFLDTDFTRLNSLILEKLNTTEVEVVEEFEKIEELIGKEDITKALNFSRFINKCLENNLKESSLDILSLVDLDSSKKEKITKYIQIEEIEKSNLERLEEIRIIENNLSSQLEIKDNVFDTTLLSSIYNTLKDYVDYFKINEKMDILSKSITNLLKQVHNDFIKRKRENNFLDFSDLNHLAIKALTKEKNNKIVLSEAAHYYRNYFLEIYVDEYQDNNNLQEYILNLIRGEDAYFFRVGDVKQAIYGFRGSNPDLFEQKYNSYKKLVIDNYNVENEYSFESDSEGICIVLKENFRSDENILKCSNFIFNRLMGNKNAGVSYDKDSALYYPKAKENKEHEITPTKFINGKTNYFTGNVIEDKKNYREQSIENIAYEILNGVKNGKKYSDYAILVRNSTKMNSFKEIFSKYNIPLFFKEKVGFTESTCFNILYNMLNFLDNTNRDASLLAILHTEIFDYNNDELLQLSLQKGKSLFEKLRNSNTEKDNKTENQIIKWLNFSLNNSLPNLLDCIERDIDFRNYLVTISVDDEELDYFENFVDIVNEYQRFDNKLSGLVSQLKTIKSEEVFETKKRTPNDSVTLSTIHISKGLEYKEVFVADLDTSFSKRGYTGEALFTENFGLSINVDNICERLGFRCPNVEKLNRLYNYNSVLIKIREREEEVRNLYVALTRAKNSLFIVSPNGIELNNDEAKDKTLSQAIIEDDNFEKILNNLLSEYEAGFDYENERDAKFEGYEAEPFYEGIEAEFKFDLGDFYKSFEMKQQNKDETEEVNVRDKIFPAKTSYSALKKINTDNSTFIQKKEKRGYLEFTTLKSANSSSKAILRGNIIHKLFEKIVNDIRNGVKIIEVREYVHNLKKTDNLFQNIKENRILTVEEFDIINNEDDLEKIENFVNSELMNTVLSAEFCQTEIAFTTSKKAKELYKDSDSEIAVILQGVVDLFIRVSNKEAIIVDYKTDHVTTKTGENILKDRHKEQLRIYKEAVEDYYQLENIKTYVYSYVLSRLIEVE
ncbi:UvrD-helicase domain-containing protein [uncultured Gemella sp.]|uniref:UvrD-helicase domain-containing protein n=1 Tax=uncultured Gemella sp. TaxID=254352 RepID=UPI0028D401E8|nr:UvrD-helicase domain-containing protein [uncultured Gemella sp.]